jgi:hypothetical protein
LVCGRLIFHHTHADVASDANVDAATNDTVGATTTNVMGISSYGSVTNAVWICSMADTATSMT